MKFAIEQLQALLRRVGLLENRITTLETIESDAGHTHTIGFTDLSDTPSAYTGQGGKLVAVNATPDGLEFVAPYTHPNHTGDVTSVGDGATTIAANAVTVAKMQQIDTQRMLGRNTAGTGNVEVLSGLPTDIDALYARLLGRSGGQHLRGGTAASNNLTLESTSHATKGAVIIQPNGGGVAIGKSTPEAGAMLDVAGIIRTAQNPAGAAAHAIILSNNDANPNVIVLNQVNFGGATQGGFISVNSRFNVFPNWVKASTSAVDTAMFIKLSPEQFGVQFGNATNTGGTTPGTQQFTITSTGNVGIGVTSPQGKLHGHDGTGGFLFVTKTGVAGTAVTIIPDGTGDVTKALCAMYTASDSSGDVASYIAFLYLNQELDIMSFGGSTLTLRVNSNGSVDVRRKAGTRTYTVALSLTWH